MEAMMILKGIGFAVLGIALFLLVTYVVMRLWNWLVPSLFNGPRLRFVQALGLFFLTRLLFGFGGFGHFGRGHYGYGPHGHGRHGYGHVRDWRHDGNRPDDQPPGQRLKPSTPVPQPGN